MSEPDLLFLPWMRRGASRSLMPPKDGRRGVGASQVSLTLNGHVPVPVPITVMGPGHVKGLDSRQVIRTDPVAGSTGFESNFFALIEFDEPSLPWLFTPLPAGASTDQLAPWICLLVVRKQAGVSLNPAHGAPLPRLRIDPPAVIQEELPDLADAWAWAHAQHASLQPGIEEAKILDEARRFPERTLSRLISPRILKPDTDYIACVVPTFELGRKAGLGEEIKAEDEALLKPAWAFASSGAGGAPAPASIELPVYYSWEFRTADGGDFRSLAMLLHAADPVPPLGSIPIDIGSSGLSGALPEHVLMPLAGALRVRKSALPDWGDQSLQASWNAKLTPVLNAPAKVSADEDPLLAPPLYGSAQSGFNVIDPQHSGRWFETINLSPVYRAIAHLGTKVVATHQDALMASAWAQAAELEKANQVLRQGEFAERLASSLYRRHLGSMSPGDGLQVLAPARDRLISLRARTATAGKLEALLEETGLDRAAYSSALRRVARPRGAVTRRSRPFETSAISRRSVLEGFVPRITTITRSVAPGGPVSLERAAASLSPPLPGISWNEASAAAVKAAPPAPNFAFKAPGEPVPVNSHSHIHPHPFPHQPPPHHLPPHGPPHGFGHHGDIGDLPDEPEVDLPHDFDPGEGAIDSPAAALFRSLAAAHLERFNPVRPPPPARPRPPIDLAKIAAAFAQALTDIRPAETFALHARALVDLPGAPAEASKLPAPIRLSPHFPQPMAEPLTEIAANLLLPGLDQVAPNTVMALETNPAFVQAFMVGLNHEMGRELLWRGYPAELTATYFDRFWKTPFPVWTPDIDPISQWGDRSLANAAQEGDLVLLVRSELLKRYPNAIISATNSATSEEKYPMFTGGFGPETRYVGFDIPASDTANWSIVIKEHPSAPRFGLRSDDVRTGNFIAAPAPSAAAVAKALRVRPVRITLPPSVLGKA